MIFAAVVACTLSCTVPAIQHFPDSMSYTPHEIILYGYSRCTGYTVNPFNWKPCQYPAALLGIYNVDNKNGQTVKFPMGVLNNTWSFYAFVREAEGMLSPISNFTSNKYP